ncbi:AAA family ATPase [Streptomyces sp. NPDC007984]|uniref:helix-turn-helix transcriptional regulator n=1 Tax=Streptomyces sp. NPDC007984 TaxID=3364801 RepID=UPI0036EB632C
MSETDSLLERQAELEALRARLEEVRAGSSAFLMLVGAAGVGKSRLLNQARRMAEEAGMRVLHGRGVPLEREFPFGVVRQLFEPALVRASARQRQELLSGAAGDAVVAVGGKPEAEGPADGALGDYAVLHGLYWLTANVSRGGPVVLLVDDLHWTDESSLRYLAYLLPRLEDVPVAVITTTRPVRPGSSPLLDVMALDPGCELLQPSDLTAEATSSLLAQLFGQAPEKDFALACHQATGGNPLLLRELIRALRAEEVAPVAGSAPLVGRIGSRAVSRRVALEFSRLPADCHRVAEALAVLAPEALLEHVTRLAGTGMEQAAEAATTLVAIELLRPVHQASPRAGYEFIHPLVQQAVYEQIRPERRNAFHREATALLTEAGASSERIATHLLRLPAGTTPHAVTVLCDAAEHAMSGGSYTGALTYLKRALTEPLSRDERYAVLAQAAFAAQRSDLPLAIEYFSEAMSLTEDPCLRARLAAPLGLALLYVERVDTGVAVLTEASEALRPVRPDDPESMTGLATATRGMTPEEDDLWRGLQAILLNIPTVAVGWDRLGRAMPALRDLPESRGIGALMLEGMIAAHETYRGDPRAVTRARRVLAHPEFVVEAGYGATTAVGAYFALVLGDLDESIAAHSALIEEARRHGSLTTLCQAFGFRALGWLRRGDLSEAETDVREALRLGFLSDSMAGVRLCSAILCETLIERGHLDEAQAVLAGAEVSGKVPANQMLFWVMHAEARLLHARGDHERALALSQQAGERFAAHGGSNPAVVAWRSVAAQSLHAMGRTEEAVHLACEEIRLARVWVADYALGRALRVGGLVTPGDEGLALLREAVDVLEAGHARVEHAAALVDLGAALRRANARAEARPHLMDGLRLASSLGAAPVVELAETELRAAGARPRRLVAEGPDSLTPSERRVADLAAQGLTNRAIAQQLYVTVKTVEVHLGNCYRKLAISGRSRLASSLAERAD